MPPHEVERGFVFIFYFCLYFLVEVGVRSTLTTTTTTKKPKQKPPNQTQNPHKKYLLKYLCHKKNYFKLRFLYVRERGASQFWNVLLGLSLREVDGIQIPAGISDALFQHPIVKLWFAESEIHQLCTAMSKTKQAGTTQQNAHYSYLNISCGM